jgi:hypothetical protein
MQFQIEIKRDPAPPVFRRLHAALTLAKAARDQASAGFLRDHEGAGAQERNADLIRFAEARCHPILPK